MQFMWPGLLVSLLIVPLSIAGYIWALRRRRRFAVRFSSLSLVRMALPRHAFLRRHLPFALLLVALASLGIAASRPTAVVAVPTSQTAIVLAIDVSRSMLADDIQPTRLEAAQAAARSFIERQGSSTQIGIVAFAGFAEVVQMPTSDQEALQAAIDSLTTGRGTAIGSGILKSIDVIAQIDPSVAPSIEDSAQGNESAPLPPGVFTPNIIVVLTDGVTTTGIQPLDAAQQATDRGVRVYTIGFGTEDGGLSFGGGNQFPGSNGQFPGNDPQFGGFRRGIDEETLKQVASMTEGKYYAAESSDELLNVFQNLPTSQIIRTESTEIAFAFVAAGTLFAILAIALSMRWNPLAWG